MSINLLNYDSILRLIKGRMLILITISVTWNFLFIIFHQYVHLSFHFKLLQFSRQKYLITDTFYFYFRNGIFAGVELEYDRFSRLTSWKWGDLTESYGFDRAGRLSEIRYGDGSAMIYAFKDMFSSLVSEHSVLWD
jgi:hypothetical protein